MEIEKTLAVNAPAEKVWEMLLDPQVMGGCVPGMQSIEVVSPTVYKAVMAVKVSFISAKFRLKTTIVEQRAPSYLRCEGTGEDTSVASSMKQQSEVFLTPQPDGSTELRLKVKVDVVGRLANFGLSAMKTKADRLWEEFGQNLKQRIEGGATPTAGPVPVQAVARQAGVASIQDSESSDQASVAHSQPLPVLARSAASEAIKPGWWSRLVAALGNRGTVTQADRMIRIDIQRDGTSITVHWPLEAAGECAAVLREALR